MNPPVSEIVYVTGIKEVLWGVLLIAITLGLHGSGMIVTVRTCSAFREHVERTRSFALGLGIIILASWLMILCHLLEVMVWALFFYANNAIASTVANPSLCFYFALLDYTTLGCSYNLKFDWRLLEGMISIAGMMTFAWSTAVLLTMAQEFQDRHARRPARRDLSPPEPPPSPSLPTRATP
jgi:hypothetical protein